MSFLWHYYMGKAQDLKVLLVSCSCVPAWQHEQQYSCEREDIRKEISCVKVTLKRGLKEMYFKVS